MTSKRKPLQGAAIFFSPTPTATPTATIEVQKPSSVEPQKPRSTPVKKHTSAEERKPRTVEAKKRTSAPLYQKVGYYLPPDLVEELDRVWLKLRGNAKKKVTKSDIVRTALETAIAEFHEQKSRGSLIERLKPGENSSHHA